ncbi:M20 family metallopeptidase [Chungangia koreensis]|uniref:M20 family metallopeptidase n=1 Tax=Chungangia koreensis TaxID=752657 RepID=A0ABV8X735_9LACT
MVIDLLKKLILIDSSTKDGANLAVDFCRRWLEEQNLTVKELTNNGYKMLVCEIGSGDQTIIFNGHVDVVSGNEEQFIPVERDGKLYGRGAADMKAGVAAMMVAMKQLKDLNLRSKVQLQIVSDEEIGGLNCSGYLADQGYRGDFVICSEPTQLGIGLQAKGVLRLDIEINGKPAHGSRPWEGVNAIEKAYYEYEKILELPFLKESSELYTSPSINLAKIQGGDAYNKVPEKCVCSLDIRYLPTQTAEEVIAQIEGVVDGKVTAVLIGNPVKTEANSPYIELLSPVIQKNLEKEARLFGQHGSADTLFFANYGIPAIEFGPSGANWHGDEEYVIVESISQYTRILVDFAMEVNLDKFEEQRRGD